MFLNSAIYEYLAKHLDMKANRLGLSMVKDDLVTLENYDDLAKFISLRVNDAHDVVIHYASAFQINTIECNCRIHKSCEHISAALQYLTKKSDEDLGIERNLKNPGIAPKILAINKPRVEKENKKKVEIVKPFFPLSNPKDVRVFPDLAKSSPEKFFQLHSVGALYMLDEVKTYIHPDGLIISEVKKRNNPKESVIVTIDIANFSIKCSECEHFTEKLCKHQLATIGKDIKPFNLASLDKFDYKKLSTEFAARLEMPLLKFEKIYTLNLAYGIVKPDSAVTKYMPTQALALFKQIVETQYQKPHEEVLDHLTLKSDLDTDRWENALMWSNGDYLNNTLRLIEGKAYKGTAKLNTTIAETDIARYLPAHLQNVYNELATCLDRYRKTPVLRTKALLKVLGQKVEVMNTFINCHIKPYAPLTKTSLNYFEFAQEYCTVEFKLEADDYFYHFSRITKLGDRIANSEDCTVFDAFIIEGEKAYLFKDIYQHQALTLSEFDSISIDIESKADVSAILVHLMQYHTVDLPADFDLSMEECNNGGKELYIREAGNALVFTPFLRYDDTLKFDLTAHDIQYVIDEQQNAALYKVNDEEKEHFIDYMKAQHATFEQNYEETGSFFIAIEDFLKQGWFLEFFKECSTQEISIFGQENLKNFKFNTNAAYINTNIASGIDWFDIDVDIKFGNQQVSNKAWIESIKNNEKYIKLDDGTYGMIPDEWFEKLKRLAKVVEVDGGNLTISKFKFGLIDQLFEKISDDELYRDIQYKVTRLTDYNKDKKYVLPPSIKAELRPYQEEGYQWLRTLDELEFGGCLADDMGLGKTLQMICLLQTQKNNDLGSSIVIVPRSLLFNWASELEKFAPELTFLAYHGPQRLNLRKDLLTHDVIITTYDTASIDVEYLKEIKFNYIILDESQAIKNPNSKRYKAMRLLQSRNRMIMTGTPLENNTFDLYAQFSFINPGIFGGQTSFKERYSNAIDRDGDEEAASMMRRIISPFFLRRTKENVAKDLPEKTENIIYCDMDKLQRSMYEELKTRIRTDIASTIQENGVAKSKFKILEGLLRLRQMCNSPLLLDATLPPHKQSSVKIETLVDILQNDLGDHSALVFSQFTSMLALIRKELDKHHIKYAYLDGSTSDRKGAVDKFQEQDDVKIFLISIKAGNTGLNLVKADYVYIVDPWWNPAVEAQAIDRTHRIGQDKHIFAYRMICKDTIEEKIVQLQQKKKRIADDIISTDENVFKSMDKEELMNLFL